MDDCRPDPDALLNESIRAERGTLTIFLGASAGVGKTYSMLESAQEKLAEKVDIIIGWLETHGRKETIAMSEGIPVIEPLNIVYKGINLQEMNLDKILARKPTIAIVDELAHTNVPGSRNKKRYQDVEELLTHGIDVYTTLNIQHLESLNDIVTDITEIPVHETVPDTFLKNTQIQLVDIDPDTLMQRLREGKVYIPEQAENALRNFFRPGNINALREISLRFTAKHVDKELASYMHAHAIEGPWTACEKVLVYIDSYLHSFHLLRIAKNLADSLQGDLVVVFHQSSSAYLVGDRAKSMLAKSIQFAEELGGEIVTIPGGKLIDSLVQIVKRKNITQLVIGKSSNKMRWLTILKEPIENSILGNLTGIRIHLIPLKKNRLEKTPIKLRLISSIHLAPLLSHILLVFILTIFCKFIAKDLGLINISMLFVLPLLLSSLWGYQNSIIISLISFLFYDYFFIPPYNTFLIHDLRYLISLFIFLLIAFLSGYISLLLQHKAEMAEDNQAQINSLFSLSKDIAIDTNLDSILKKIIVEISENTDSKVSILLPDENGNLVNRSSNDDQFCIDIEKKELAVASWSYHNKQVAGKGTNTLSGSSNFYFPIMTNRNIFGVIALNSSWISINQDLGMKKYLEAIASLTAIAVHRHKLTEKANENKVMVESQRLQKALFDSISHDLNTPLTSILGAVGSLLEEEDLYSKEDKTELLQSIQQGAYDMNRLVRNLLDMAQLDSRVLTIHKEYADMADIVEDSLLKLKQSSKWQINKIIDVSLPAIKIDSTLIEQVVINLLDNAFKYSKEGSKITIRSYAESNRLYFMIEDEGIGISPEELDSVFSKFYRSNQVKTIRGSGLGLSICRGIIEAHGGKIWASHKQGAGSRITFFLPYDWSA